MDPDTSDYGALPPDLPVHPGLPTREVLARLGLDAARWRTLDQTARIVAVAGLFPGMAYVGTPFNPINRTIFYLDQYAARWASDAAQGATPMISPAGQAKAYPSLRATGLNCRQWRNSSPMQKQDVVAARLLGILGDWRFGTMEQRSRVLGLVQKLDEYCQTVTVTGSYSYGGLTFPAGDAAVATPEAQLAAALADNAALAKQRRMYQWTTVAAVVAGVAAYALKR